MSFKNRHDNFPRTLLRRLLVLLIPLINLRVSWRIQQPRLSPIYGHPNGVLGLGTKQVKFMNGLLNQLNLDPRQSVFDN